MKSTIRIIIKEEINDFDWAKEINPIQCKDLKGYYFYYGTDIDDDPFIRKFVIEDVFIKNPRGYGRGNDLDSLKIYYTWGNGTTFDWNQMECDTFIHRVKTGDYTLYDKNGVKVNPRDLAYTDGTFDDDERKEIWEQDESDDFDWIRNVSLTKYRPRIGEYIEVISIGGNEDYRNWLGDYVYAYEEGMYGATIKGVVKDPPPNTDEDLGFTLQEENTDDEIYFPFYEYIKTLSSGQYEDYKNLKLEYRPLFPLEVQIKNSSINESDEWEWAREINYSQLNPFYEEGIALQIDTEPTLEQAEMVFEWLVQAGKTTAYLNRTHDRAKKLTERASLYTYILGFEGSDWLWHVVDENYSQFVSEGKIRKLIKLSDIFPTEDRKKKKPKKPKIKQEPIKQEQLKEEQLEDEWEWAKTSKPVELQDPKEWVGRQFGYGQEIIDQMSDAEIVAGDDEEFFTITGIDKNDNLILIKHHPVYGDNHDSSTSPRNLRDYISSGKWIWK